MCAVHRNSCHMKNQQHRRAAKAAKKQLFQAAKAADEDVADKCWICCGADCQGPRDCLHPSAPAKREERLEKRRQTIATIKAKLPYIIYQTIGKRLPSTMKNVRKDQRDRSKSPMTPRAEDIYDIPVRMWKHETLQWDKQFKQNFWRSVAVKNTFLEVTDELEDPQPVLGRSSTR